MASYLFNVKQYVQCAGVKCFHKAEVMDLDDGCNIYMLNLDDVIGELMRNHREIILNIQQAIHCPRKLARLQC